VSEEQDPAADSFAAKPEQRSVVLQIAALDVTQRCELVSEKVGGPLQTREITAGGLDGGQGPELIQIGLQMIRKKVEAVHRPPISHHSATGIKAKFDTNVPTFKG
jgi:hypothetical protein